MTEEGPDHKCIVCRDWHRLQARGRGSELLVVHGPAV